MVQPAEAAGVVVVLQPGRGMVRTAAVVD